MYYYISFLKPPPIQATLSSSILITPQIANDLRTESFQTEMDLFYSWYPVDPNSRTAKPTKPIKLTTYRPENAYKEMKLTFPSGNRDVQAWRLVLTADSERTFIDLDSGLDDTLGRALPFPVMSMPISATKNAGKDTGKKKQESIERLYRLGRFDDENTLLLRIMEQTAFDLDKKIWDSGIGLASWLVSFAKSNLNMEGEIASSNSLLNTLQQALFSPSRRIIELGAGTGMVSLTLGALRSATVSPKSSSPSAVDRISHSPAESETTEEDKGCIITTDLPSAMPLLEQNISLNRHLFSNLSTRPRPEILDWDKELPEYTQELQENLDAIVMADVTYNTSSFPALIRTLSNLINLNPPSLPPPIILLGYKERDSAERTLWDMAANIEDGAGIRFNRVGERWGFGGADGGEGGRSPVEIWIGEVFRK
ncbi:hypothetical protein D9757_010330 [Collybiopsis confluens]|uniref:Methyltransferase-domain-containing protein n=1 Tax=Collybiopsis confluens TaxID=2823264 RepID=A0A8H5GMS6_9AGAR|nr:hypothetical protein D9757_010330 [Collybiopsis confluens]